MCTQGIAAGSVAVRLLNKIRMLQLFSLSFAKVFHDQNDLIVRTAPVVSIETKQVAAYAFDYDIGEKGQGRNSVPQPPLLITKTMSE
jgi:hypothetical protein